MQFSPNLQFFFWMSSHIHSLSQPLPAPPLHSTQILSTPEAKSDSSTDTIDTTKVVKSEPIHKSFYRCSTPSDLSSIQKPVLDFVPIEDALDSKLLKKEFEIGKNEIFIVKPLLLRILHKNSRCMFSCEDLAKSFTFSKILMLIDDAKFSKPFLKYYKISKWEWTIENV